MINKVNATLLKMFLGLYCLSLLIIRLSHDVFLTSLLFRTVSILNHIHLHLFIFNSYIIKTVSWLVFSIQASYKMNSRCFLNIIIV